MSFDLAIGSRMGNRDIFEGDASVFVEVPKMMTSECSSEVGDNVVRETESMDDIFEVLDCLLCSSQNKRLVFDPLGELVNGNIYVPKTTWHVYLLGKKLTSFTTSDEVFYVGDGPEPIKTSS